jgi:uncharacterized OB-fold protein
MSLRPAVDGLFVIDPEPALIGGRRSTGSYLFPLIAGAGDPDAADDDVEQVLLSRHGRVWSWTDTQVSPPPPYIAAADPYEPVGIVAVELEHERMVVLGQLAEGVLLTDLRLGMEMELTTREIGSSAGEPVLTWAWTPRSGEVANRG